MVLGDCKWHSKQSCLQADGHGRRLNLCHSKGFCVMIHKQRMHRDLAAFYTAHIQVPSLQRSQQVCSFCKSVNEWRHLTGRIIGNMWHPDGDGGLRLWGRTGPSSTTRTGASVTPRRVSSATDIHGSWQINCPWELLRCSPRRQSSLSWHRNRRPSSGNIVI